MRAEVQEKSFAQQLHLHLPMKQCESTGGRALPCPASSWKKSHSHLLFPQTSHGWSRSACSDSCYSARHSLSSPPAFFWDWVGDASPWNQYWVWINPLRQFDWAVSCKAQACHEEHKAAHEGFLLGVLAQSCTGQLEFSLRESNSLAFSGLLPLFSPWIVAS